MEMDTDTVVVANVNINWSQMDSLKFMGLASSLSFSVRTVMYPFTLVRTRLQNQDTRPLHTAYQIQKVDMSHQGIRQQTHTGNSLKSKGYSGMLDAFTKTYKSNGIRGLYDGFSVNCLSVFQHVMYIAVLEYTREKAEMYLEGSKLFSQNTIKYSIAPMIGAMCATSTFVISVPTDVVSQYLQDAKSHGSKGTDISLLHNIRNLPPNESVVSHTIQELWKVGGLRAFFKGFGVTCSLSLINGSFWPFYLSMKSKVFEKLNLSVDDPWTVTTVVAVSLSAAVACGISCLISNPIELTRNQAQMHQQQAWKMFKMISRIEGFNMFLKGLTPRLVHSTINCIIGVPLYELVKKRSLKEKFENL